jgi:anti-sigma regulatory factor (Ser/Thr protein kinase)
MTSSMMSAFNDGMAMDSETFWSHEVVLAADAGSASKARAFVLQHLAEHRLLYLVDDIGLVVSELATNAILHAKTAFTVTLDGRSHSVLLMVRDGSLTTPTLSHAALNGTSITGRGLIIVNVISDTWGVHRGDGSAKSVWASFDTRGPLKNR